MRTTDPVGEQQPDRVVGRTCFHRPAYGLVPPAGSDEAALADMHAVVAHRRGAEALERQIPGQAWRGDEGGRIGRLKGRFRVRSRSRILRAFGSRDHGSAVMPHVTNSSDTPISSIVAIECSPRR